MMDEKEEGPVRELPFPSLCWRMVGFLSASTVVGVLLVGLEMAVRGVLNDPPGQAAADILGILFCVFSASPFMALAYRAWPREG